MSSFISERIEFFPEEELKGMMINNIKDRHNYDSDQSEPFFPTKYFHYELNRTSKLPRSVVSCLNNEESNKYDRFFKVEFLYPRSTTIRSIGNQQQFTWRQAEIFNHYFSFSFCGDTDVTFERIMGMRCEDGFDDYTPDYYFESPGSTFVVEFGTVAFSKQQYMINYADTKRVKYQQALSNRADLGVTRIQYDIIIVSPNSILSTFKMSHALASEIIYRNAVANSITQRLRDFGVSPASEDAALTQASRKAEAILESIQFNFDQSGEWTKENYERWTSDFSNQEFHRSAELFVRDMKKAGVVVENEANKRKETELFRNIEFERRLKEFSISHGKLNTRRDKKTITPWPCFVVECRGEFHSFNFKDLHFELNTNDAMGSIWYSAIMAAKIDEHYQFEENISETIEKLKSSSVVSDYTKRSKYKRLNIAVPPHFESALAEQGINGKRFKDHENKITADEKSKWGFHMEVDTDNIERFVNNFNLLESSSCSVNYLFKYDELINRALELSSSDKGCLLIPSNTMINLFKQTDFFSYAMLITELSIELLLSLRQNCKKNEFILKTLKFRDVLMLIKPTNSQEHVFVSLLMKESSVKNMHADPFNKIFQDGNSMLTKFFSFDSKKLSQYALCGPMMLNMFTFWAQFYKIRLDTETLSMAGLPADFKKMMNVSLLTFLEQKISTEEIMTQFRYLSMEGMKDYPGFCDTLKVLDKMPNYFRSRLTVWTFKKLMVEAKLLYGHGYRFSKSADGKLSWSNLRNPYTQSKLSEPSQLINLYYLGYLRDKNVKSHNNQDAGLISKILKGEYSYWGSETEGKLGRQEMNPELKYSPHAYDVTVMRCIAEHLKTKYHENTGVDPESNIYQAFLRNMVYMPLDAFTTLKASSAFLPGDESLALGDTGNLTKNLNKFKRLKQKTADSREIDIERYNQEMMDVDGKIRDLERKLSVFYVDRPRPRVVEAFSEVLVNKDFLFDYLPEALEISNKHGLFVDLFKKAQMGGLREIYVLNKEARFIQYAIEQLSRIICMAFDSETMTHPKNKLNLMTSHGHRTRAICKHLSLRKETRESQVINSNSSKDKKSWNNTNSPSKFAIILLRMTPKVMHPFIFNTLKCWDNKKILLPKGLRNTIIRGNLRHVGDPNLCKFFDSLSSLEDKTGVTKKGRPWISIKTGMMQGILHFTSSLAHAGFNEIISEYFSVMARRKDNFIVRSLFTHLESSDDTSYLKTLWVRKGCTDWALRFMYQFDLAAAHFGRYAGFHESFEKSTHHSTQTIEFNSEFCVNNQINKPDIKFVIASLRIPECESVSEIYYQYKNLLTSCLEGGSTLLACHQIQKNQALMHYLTFGLTSNPIFPSFAKTLVRITDPGVGFFLLDPYTLAGVVDQQFCVWLATQRNPLFSMRIKMLMETEKLSSYSSGMMTRAAVLPMGDRKRWRRIMSSIEKSIGSFNQEEYLNENPRILFDKPKNKKEKIASLYLKLRCPTVVSSLGNTGRLDRVIIKGAYVLQYPCITLGSVWEDVVDEFKKKMSLVNLMQTIENLTVERVMKVIEETTDETDVNYLQETIENIKKEVAEGWNAFQELQLRSNPIVLSPSDLKSLFPHHIDYEGLLRIHEQSRATTWSFWENSEKKKARIVILQSPGNVYLGLENICKTLWFGDNYHHIPKKLFASQLRRYQSKYSWLKDTFHKSFKESRFENMISFANFIKEQAGKNRQVNVCSAPLKIDKGSSSLRALINRHMWPNALLAPTLVETSDNTDSKEVFHIAASLAALPLQPNKRVKLFLDLCHTRAENSFGKKVLSLLEKEMCTRREERMKPILAYAAGELPDKVQECLLRSKMGIMGSWTKSETYQNGKYYGDGEWQGTIDDVSIIVRTRSGEIQDVRVSNALKFREVFRMFMEWVDETHLLTTRYFSLSSKESKRAIGFIQDRRWHDTEPAGKCVPILLLEGRCTPSLRNVRGFKIDFTQRSIRLRAEVLRIITDNLDREDMYAECTLVSVRLYDSDILKNPCTYNIADDLLSKLLSNLTLIDPDYISRSDTTIVRRGRPLQVRRQLEFSIDSIDPARGCNFSEFKAIIRNNGSEGRRSFLNLLTKKLRYRILEEIPLRSTQELIDHVLDNSYESNYVCTETALDLFAKDMMRRLRSSSLPMPQCLLDRGITTWFNAGTLWATFDSDIKWSIISQAVGKPILFLSFNEEGLPELKVHSSRSEDLLNEELLYDMKLIIKSSIQGEFLACHPPIVSTVRTIHRTVPTAAPDMLPENIPLKDVLAKLLKLKLILERSNYSQLFDLETLRNTLSKWLLDDLCDEGLITSSEGEYYEVRLGNPGQESIRDLRVPEPNVDDQAILPIRDMASDAFYDLLDELDFSDDSMASDDVEELSVQGEIISALMTEEEQYDISALIMSDEEIAQIGQLVSEEAEWKPLNLFRGNFFRPLAQALRKFCKDQFKADKNRTMTHDCDVNLFNLLNYFTRNALKMETVVERDPPQDWDIIRAEAERELENLEEE